MLLRLESGTPTLYALSLSSCMVLFAFDLKRGRSKFDQALVFDLGKVAFKEKRGEGGHSIVALEREGVSESESSG